MKRALLIAVLMVIAMITPTAALSAEMKFHATCIPDTLHPGELTKITVLIDNDARANGFVVNPNTSDLMNIITTAYNVRANMSGDLPFTVENAHYQLVGTIPSARVGKAIFIVKVPDNAKSGTYSVPVHLKYTQIVATQTTNGFMLTYLEQVDTVYVKINIVKKDFDISLKSLTSLLAGEEGTVKIAVTNTGKYTMDNLSIVANLTPPFKPNPGSNTAFLGKINPGQTKYAEIKLFVSSSALNQTYPLKLLISFNTPGGKPIIFPKIIGIRVISKDIFNLKVISSNVPRYVPLPPTVNLPPPSTTTTSNSQFTTTQNPEQTQMNTMDTIYSIGYVVVKVTSNTLAKDVTLNMISTNPMITAITNPYVGTLKPGESKEAIFYIRSMAPEGTYKAFIVVSYKNSAGDSVISKKYPVAIRVCSPPFKVVKISTKNLYVGNIGEVDVKVTGNITNANFYLISPDPSIKPVSLTSYAPNSNSTLHFRVYVYSQSTDGYHCMYLVGRYDEGDANNLVSIVKIPIFVEPKTVLFRVEKVESIGLYPDETGTVKVTVVNAGNAPVYNAVVELGVSAPLSIAGESAIGSMIGVTIPGTYFVGTLKPGQSATASFRIKVDKHAGAGNYPANVRILYYDSNGYKHLSNSITVSVEVKNKPLLTPLTISATIFTAIGFILAIRYAKKRKNKNNK